MAITVKGLPSVLLLLSIWFLHVTSSENKILELNDDNFLEKTKAMDWSLVIFFRNWCTLSKKVIKEFVKAADVIDDDRLLFGKVDCETDGFKTCEKFSVSQVPILFLFKKGNYFKEYLGKPDYIGMVRFTKSETGPGYALIQNELDKEVFFSGRESKLVGTFKVDSVIKKTFLHLIDQWKHHFDFGISTVDTPEKDVIELIRPNHLHNKFEPSQISYEGSGEAEDIGKWMIANKHGIVGHRHKYNFNDFKEPLVVVYYELDYERAPQVTHYWRNRVIKVAKSHSDFNFAVSTMKEFNKELVNFGYNFMRPTITPLVCAYIKGKRYPMKEEFSVEAFAQFMEDLKIGRISPHMRSDDIPKSNDSPVKIAVARNFDTVVEESGKDTLIKFYAPWCTWCKKLAPVWEELGNVLKNEQVDIVKYNAENNEVPPQYEVNGYPTLFWVPRDNKKSPILYNGGRDFQDFIKYIAKHATEELVGFDRLGNPKTQLSDEEKKETEGEL